MSDDIILTPIEFSQLLDLKNSIDSMIDAKNPSEREIREAYVVIGNINLLNIIDRQNRLNRCDKTFEMLGI